MASNINHLSDKKYFKKFVKIESDSISVGIFSIYTPDYLVKSDVSVSLIFDYKFFEYVKKESKKLKKKVDFLILMTGLSLYTTEKMVENTNIDAVVSFDYAPKSDRDIGKIKYYNTSGRTRKSGTMIIKMKNGKLSHKWSEKKLNL